LPQTQNWFKGVIQVSNTLLHYGIKGMRWGIRRSNPSGGGPISSRIKKTTPDQIGKAKSAADEGSKSPKRELTSQSQLATLDQLGERKISQIFPIANLELE
jgi:hypothetical protein